MMHDRENFRACWGCAHCKLGASWNHSETEKLDKSDKSDSQSTANRRDLDNSTEEPRRQQGPCPGGRTGASDSVNDPSCGAGGEALQATGSRLIETSSEQPLGGRSVVSLAGTTYQTPQGGTARHSSHQGPTGTKSPRQTTRRYTATGQTNLASSGARLPVRSPLLKRQPSPKDPAHTKGSDLMSASVHVGDGVYYHGSAKDVHGCYTVIHHDKGLGRYVLADADDNVLYHVRGESFEVLLPVGDK